MIHSNQLTEEAGFVEGCIIKIVWSNEAGGNTEYLNSSIYRSYTKEAFENIISIRPLTGPMAIWNFAPDWAEWATAASDGINFYYAKGWLYRDGEIVSRRPFWAKRSKQPNTP